MKLPIALRFNAVFSEMRATHFIACSLAARLVELNVGGVFILRSFSASLSEMDPPRFQDRFEGVLVVAL